MFLDHNRTFDVVIVGGGPSGLATAIRLRLLAMETGTDVSVCVVEKGGAIGAHSLSGAVIDPCSLTELIPDWAEKGAPLKIPVAGTRFGYLTKRRRLGLPPPPVLRNRNCYVSSVGALSRWMGEQAAALGVALFPRVAVSHALFDDHGAVCGVRTGDRGLNRDGSPGPAFQPGVNLNARVVVLAEGSRGSVTRCMVERFDLVDPYFGQIYGLGLKEVWEIPPQRHRPGQVSHTIGWPLAPHTFGGGFLYHFDGNRIALGLVVGLDYENPYLSPFHELQRLKTHPMIRALLEGGRCIGYGARTLTESGLQGLPKLAFPGGVIVGDAAGFLNVARLKGTHTAIKSGQIAADAIFEHLVENRTGPVDAYPVALKQSWLWKELRSIRNVRTGFQKGFWKGVVLASINLAFSRGSEPWTFEIARPESSFDQADRYERIDYSPPDGKLTFDRLSMLPLCGISYTENQPCHIKLRDPDKATRANLALYEAPETRYCPAGVFEFVPSALGALRLKINAGNCLHCKTCDIIDPFQNIVWTPPQGGDGPNYSDM